MKWLVQQNLATVSYDAYTLITQFMAQKKISNEHKELASTLLNRLGYSQELINLTPLELVTLGIFIGYYYRLFKEKNNPTIEVVDETINTRNSQSSNY